jgi:hypothetical protein
VSLENRLVGKSAKENLFIEGSSHFVQGPKFSLNQEAKLKRNVSSYYASGLSFASS